MEIVKKFSDFLGESNDFGPEPDVSVLNEAVSATLRKSLDELGTNLKTDEDIVKAIESAGLKKIQPSGGERSADYAFAVPGDKEQKKFISYTTGYVRAIWTSKSYWSGSTPVTKMTPITREKLSSSRDRLLLILRRAIKLMGVAKPSAKKEETKPAEKPTTEKPTTKSSGETSTVKTAAPVKTGIAGLSKEELSTIRAQIREEEKMIAESLKVIEAAIKSEMKKFDDPSEFIARLSEMIENL